MRGKAIGAIFLFFLILGLVSFLKLLLNPVYPIFSIIDDDLNTLGFSWLPFDIMLSISAWVISLYQLRDDDSLVKVIGDEFLRRIDYVVIRRLRKIDKGIESLQDNHGQLREMMSENLEQQRSTHDDMLEVKAGMKEIQGTLSVLVEQSRTNPEQVDTHIQEIDTNERNLIAEELGKRITNYKIKLQHISSINFPKDYASTQEKLGRTYWVISLIRDKELHLNHALKSLQESLNFYAVEMYPEDYARLKRLVGNVYSTYADVRDSEVNCNKAIAAYRDSLQYYTAVNHPLEYTKVMNNIGLVYGQLADAFNVTDYCSKSLVAYNKALVTSSEKFPVLSAMILNNIGATFLKLARQGSSNEVRMNCELAIVSFEKALKVRSKNEFPLDYATTQHNLGIAYAQLGNVNDRKKNCQLAITAFNAALAIRTLEEYPLYYASTKHSLGSTYLTLAKEFDRKENCQLAITALIESLEIYSIDYYPEKNKKVQRTLDFAHELCIFIHPY